MEKKGWWLGLNGEGGGKTKGWAGREGLSWRSENSAGILNILYTYC